MNERDISSISMVRDFIDTRIKDFIDERIMVCEILFLKKIIY